ncbi:MAG: lipoprotein [Polaromonas sp.]|uniref:LPS translocon maturation chaperone LptM n=1 Tax=Comamonadaceae TaxID=80864 RepID=UPI002730CEC3|nr:MULTISPECIES: lipoprotein [Comamonadaceae]MDP1684425.1 lipoprotein [Hydrogenophaga sp.]MDP3249726.1 lipoprotein [Polaromonas sp.]
MLRTTRILGRPPSRTRGVAIALSVLLLSACGQKGPLFLPTAEPKPASSNPTPPAPPPGTPVQR